MGTFAQNPYAIPVVEAGVEERVTFLRKVGMWTFLGLLVAAVTSVFSAGAVFVVPALQNQWVSIAIMLGSIFAAQFVGNSLVNRPDASSQTLGFFLGTALQGVAMGYLILTATILSYEVYANPIMFIAQALGLVGLTVLGMVAYLMTGPRQLNWIGAGLATLGIPMLILMVISFVFPIGGTIGLLISVGFVVISAGGLLYNLNLVIHQMSTNMVIPAAYHVALGILVLFWNILTLLMRLQDRR
jgi:FtsH-binding integral membrane protein